MDTNVNEEVDMDLLVDENPDPIEDYKEEVNKEVEEQNPDPDQVVKADLEMDPAAATESFIRKHFGISVEELEEEADAKAEEGEELVENSEAVPETTEDELLGIEPATTDETTVVTVTPPAGGDTTVTEDGGVPVEAADLTTTVEETPVIDVPEVSVEPETPAQVSSLENLRAILSREDDDTSADPSEGAASDEPDVSLNVETPNNNVDIDLDDKAVTIEPVEEGSDDSGSDEGSSDDVPAPETDEGSEESNESGEESGSEEGGESSGEEEEGSAESWWMI